MKVLARIPQQNFNLSPRCKLKKFINLTLSKDINEKKLFNKIYDENLSVKYDADKLLMNYQDLLPNKNLYSYEDALKRFYNINPYMKIFCDKVKESKLDVLVGGSIGLYSVYNVNYKHGDIDIYIKNFKNQDLCILENIIYQSFDIESLIIIRKPITLTFYIQTKDEFLYNIQLNILNPISWSQVLCSHDVIIPQ